jgi:hypothetical protein
VDAERLAEYERVAAERENDPEFWRKVTDELRALWKRALEREGNLASAVADVIWKCAPYGVREDGSVAAYLVPSGCVHRLVGVAQSNGAHVPVAFRNLAAGDSPAPTPKDGE